MIWSKWCSGSRFKKTITRRNVHLLVFDDKTRDPGLNGELRATGESRLLEQMLDMGLYRILRDVEFLSDFFIARAGR